MNDLKQCILIVDVQAGFINEYTKHIPLLVENIQHEYKYAVAAKFFNPEHSFFRKLIKWDSFSLGSKDVELAFNFREDGLIIEKSIYSCVSDDFLSWLHNKDISVVHICGVDTDICVSKCAVDLFEKGIEPVVLGNLCASYAGEESHNFGLATLKRFIGESQVK